VKKLFVILLLPVLLFGCAAEPVFERVDDVYVQTSSTPGTVEVMIPEKATVLTAAGEGSGRLYFCEGYTMTVQTLAGGNLDSTFRALTGYGREALTIIETLRGDVPCYSCAWISAGENGDQVGRLVVLDDGVYHYAVTVMASAARAGELAEEWDQILSRVSLSDTAA